jgi:hypothetical protein
LEDRLKFAPDAQHATDPRRAVCGQIADLNAASAKDGDRMRIDRVLRLRQEVYRFAGHTE